MGRNHGAALLSCPGISTCMPREAWTPALINVRCTLHDDWAPKPLRQAFRKTNAGVHCHPASSQSGHCSKAKCRPERQKAVPRSARPRRRARQNAARADETRARTRVIRSWLDARGNASRRTGRTAQTSARSSPILGRRPAALLPLPHTPPRRESGTARANTGTAGWHRPRAGASLQPMKPASPAAGSTTAPRAARRVGDRERRA